MEKCLKCGNEILISALRKHLEVCGRLCISVLDIIVALTDKSYYTDPPRKKVAKRVNSYRM